MAISKKLSHFLKTLFHPNFRFYIRSLSRSSRRTSFSSSETLDSCEISCRNLSYGSRGRSRNWVNTVASCDCEEDCCWGPPTGVPEGCFPVYVGLERRRFLIQTSHLRNDIFQLLLSKSEEEYGLSCEGGLRIACHPDVFEHYLRWLESKETHCPQEMKQFSAQESTSICATP